MRLRSDRRRRRTLLAVAYGGLAFFADLFPSRDERGSGHLEGVGAR